MEDIKNEVNDRVFALLIDGDNVSPKYISAIMKEVTAKYGSLSFRRIYGDFTTNQKSSWKSVLLEHSITPIQQYNNTVGKNSSDSALIIDAMDILYTGKVDGFCIVSSDGDFTRLASRLRESQMFVIVMGEEKTPRSIRMACDKFITLENLIENYDDKKSTSASTKKRAQALPKENVIDAITDIIADIENNGRQTHLGELGSKLSTRYPDFDTRDYGYSSLSKFIEETPEFKLYKIGVASYVKVYDRSQQAEDVKVYALNVIKSAGAKGIAVGDLSNKLHLKFPAFTPKTYGYSQFTKFVDGLPGIKIVSEGKNKLAKLANK